MNLRRYSSLVLCCVLCLFVLCSSTCYAVEANEIEIDYEHHTVSGGDLVSLPQMVMLSSVKPLSTEDYSVATTNTYYRNTIADGSKTVRYSPSYYTGVDTLSFKLFDVDLSTDIYFPNVNQFMGVFKDGFDISGATNGMNYLGYQLWAVIGGEKFYFSNYYNAWLTFTHDHYFGHSICTIGIDLKFAPVFSNPTGSITANPNNTGGYYITDDTLTRDSGGYITVAWSGFEWQLADSHTSDSYWNSKNNADMNTGLTNIFNRLEDVRISLWNQIENLRISLWNKIDEFRIQVYDNFRELIDSIRVLTFGTASSGSSTSLISGESGGGGGTLQEQANETQKNIFDKILELPSKIAEAIKGLFVPSEEDMSEYKDKWDALLADRFGAVYEAGAIITDTLGSLKASEQQGYISVPEVTVKLVDTNFTVGGWDVRIIPEGFEFLQTLLKRFVDILCTVLFVNALRDKYENIMGGR